MEQNNFNLRIQHIQGKPNGLLPFSSPADQYYVQVAARMLKFISETFGVRNDAGQRCQKRRQAKQCVAQQWHTVDFNQRFRA
jgi:hypothetical protein